MVSGLEVAVALGPGALAPLATGIDIGSVPPLYRAVGSFVFVLLAGAAVLVRSQAFVEGSVDASLAEPHVSVLYGAVGFGLVGFLGFVSVTQLTYVGLATTVGVVFLALVGLVMVALAGLGYAVVGTWLVELAGERQPWNGLVLGAAMSAVAWVALPLVAAGVAWMLVAAVGIGGPVREWMHAERTVAAETGS